MWSAPPDLGRAETIEKSHGRIETTASRSAHPALLWATEHAREGSVAQVCRIMLCRRAQASTFGYLVRSVRAAASWAWKRRCAARGRIAVGKTLDRRGKPLTKKAGGPVEPYFRDLPTE